MTFKILIIVASFSLALSHTLGASNATNPIMWADVPDVSTIRVGDTYYMSSTTMHMSPGLPIMKSKDLVNWEIVGYAYDRLLENYPMNLANSKDAYGKGSWASSLRYHNDRFYVSTFSATSGKTHVYSTQNIEKGPWEASSFEPVLHDNSLFFDDDGRVYMIYGARRISLIELLPDLSGIKSGGIHKVIIENTNALFAEDVGGLSGEGSQMFKVDGKYYLFNIASPASKWARTVLIHRADEITGPYQGRIALQDRHIAQGGLVDTPDGKWYATLFGDSGAVGRIPYLVPVQWKDGWPVLGTDGKVPEMLEIVDRIEGLGNLVTSDEFERTSGEPTLPFAWQWNHNPDNDHWALLQNPGRLRITTARIDANVLHARNTLTQRTVGPESSASTLIDVSQMKNGDFAGLIALQNLYGFVGVNMHDGKKSIVMVKATPGGKSANEKQAIKMFNTLIDSYEITESIPLDQAKIYLRIECDFKTDRAVFHYSLNGDNWNEIGDSLQMVYTLSKHFMGYRYGLFNYATETPGGFVDFDYYHISYPTPGID